MLQFNNNHIFTGYLKQLLANQPLTQYRIYTPQLGENVITSYLPQNTASASTLAQLQQVIGKEYTAVYYVKDGTIQCKTEEGWTALKPTLIDDKVINPLQYTSNGWDANHTRTLPLSTNIYDAQTHQYLGDFLRFLRDYHKLDLMSLYNCFTNKLVDSIKLDLIKSPNMPALASVGGAKEPFARFNAADSRYKLYAIPVKMFKKYTIAVDSASGYQLCCTLYDTPTKAIQQAGASAQTFPQNFAQTIAQATYAKQGASFFKNPFVYSGAALIKSSLKKVIERELDENKEMSTEQKEAETEIRLNKWLAYIANMQRHFCLILKLPANTSSSITILQGDYSCYNDAYLTRNLVTQNLEIKRNAVVCNAGQYEEAIQAFKPIGPLQLLQANTGISYPFADRLFEYLTGQAITNHENIADNVKRIQATLTLRPNIDHAGVWEDKYRVMFYNYMQKYAPGMFDVLGYVDKDVQHLFVVKSLTSAKQQSLTSVNIYQQLYTQTGR